MCYQIALFGIFSHLITEYKRYLLICDAMKYGDDNDNGGDKLFL